MNSGSRIGIVVGAAVIIAVGMGARQIAGAADGPSGNLNLRLEGYEVVTPPSSGPVQVNILGIGQLIGDTGGNLSGTETFTAVAPGVPTQDVCNGTVSGSITAPGGGFASGDGEFTISLTFTPSGSGAYCIPATAALFCNRTPLHARLVDDLDAGQYHCVVTGMTTSSGATSTIDAASMTGHVGSVRGSNVPTD